MPSFNPRNPMPLTTESSYQQGERKWDELSYSQRGWWIHQHRAYLRRDSDASFDLSASGTDIGIEIKASDSDLSSPYRKSRNAIVRLYSELVVAPAHEEDELIRLSWHYYYLHLKNSALMARFYTQAVEKFFALHPYAKGEEGAKLLEPFQETLNMAMAMAMNLESADRLRIAHARINQMARIGLRLGVDDASVGMWLDLLDVHLMKTQTIEYEGAEKKYENAVGLMFRKGGHDAQDRDLFRDAVDLVAKTACHYLGGLPPNEAVKKALGVYNRVVENGLVLATGNGGQNVRCASGVRRRKMM